MGKQLNLVNQRSRIIRPRTPLSTDFQGLKHLRAVSEQKRVLKQKFLLPLKIMPSLPLRKSSHLPLPLTRVKLQQNNRSLPEQKLIIINEAKTQWLQPKNDIWHGKEQKNSRYRLLSTTSVDQWSLLKLRKKIIEEMIRLFIEVDFPHVDPEKFSFANDQFFEEELNSD
ncbi:hypothetical protein Sjap_011035 [Stephania japonica]|uniref:Uncharacterized protein n=1 Tax=Stephania japonica TaxID=461633 RepID=A0AAP0JCR3_9MAGN